jgi:NAD-dependent histone deacetylase SIR2
VHGGLDKMVCNKCSTLSDLDADLFDGPIAPICANCETVNDIRTNIEGKRSHGIGRLRPRMVLYNEHNPDDEAIGKVASEDLRRRPDAVIVVGTTLKIPGVQRIVREMCGVVRNRKDGMAIWINNDPPPSGPQYSDCWDIIVRGKADAVANHAAMRRWDDLTNAAELDNISDEEVIERAKAMTASVVLPRHDLPSQLESSPLPEGHINNSFRPPTESPSTPRHRRVPVQSPDFSPLTGRRPSVIPTTEQATDGDNIVVAESGLLTPSKSQRSSTPALASAFDNLQNKGKAKGRPPKSKAGKGKAAPKKATTGKVVIPAKTKAAKAAPIKSSASLKSSFASRKGNITATEGKKVLGDLPHKLPSKLREVSNQSPDAPNTASPADIRNRISPTITKRTLPWLKRDSDNNAPKKTMDLASVMN